MRRAALIALAFSGCASDRGIYVAAGDDPIVAATAELLRLELAENPEGARRVGCGDAFDCIGKLRGGAADVAVVERDELEWLAPAGELVIAAELPIERSFTLARSGTELNFERLPVAVSLRFAARPSSGMVELAKKAGLTRPRVQVIDDHQARAAALMSGAVPAAVFESWRLPPAASVGENVRGGRFVVVTRPDVMERERDRDAVGRAAGAVSIRLEQLGDRIRSAIAAGVDPVEAVRSLAPRDRSPPAPILIRHEIFHHGHVSRIERALATRTLERLRGAGTPQLELVNAGTAPIQNGERVVVYDDGSSTVVELWSEVGLLDRDEVRRILASSPHARLPAGEGPSAWRRLSEQPSSASRGAGRGLDTLFNVAAVAFLLWVLVLIVRARADAEAESTDPPPPDK